MSLCVASTARRMLFSLFFSPGLFSEVEILGINEERLFLLFAGRAHEFFMKTFFFASLLVFARVG